MVRALPKTRSGKVLRGTIRKIADGEEWKMPATIEDPAVLDDFQALLAASDVTTGSDPFVTRAPTAARFSRCTAS